MHTMVQSFAQNAHYDAETVAQSAHYGAHFCSMCHRHPPAPTPGSLTLPCDSASFWHTY